MQHDVHDPELPTEARGECRAAAPPAPAGAPSCNTAHANSICKILRHGIDSLYVSYPGQLSERMEKTLGELKQRAQTDSESVVATAQLSIWEHLFAVLDRGRKRFAYVLDDNWFSIAVSSITAKAMPLAHVQISSELITAVGIPEAMQHLDAVIERLGACGQPTVSRADLFADFITDVDLESFPKNAWVKRCKKRALYDDDDRFTGIAFGQGGKISARLYDKTHEILKSKKDYLKPIWAAAGWQEGQTVWRLEFQVRREALPDTITESIDRFVQHQSIFVWSYCTSEWLRLTIPSANDETRSRWPNHPLWDVLAGLGEAVGAPTRLRVPKQRIPLDNTLFKAGIWGLTSFMAREGITDLGEGVANYLRGMERFHAELSNQPEGPEALERYINRKVLAKGRRFNTIRNGDDEPE